MARPSSSRTLRRRLVATLLVLATSLSRWFTGVGSVTLQAVSYLSSAVICSLLTLAAIKFVGFEVQMESTVFLDLPAWIPEMIIPVTFGLMTLRFAGRFLNEIKGTLIRTPRK